MQGIISKLEGMPSLYRWVAIPVLLLLFFLAYWYFFYKPNAEAIARLEGEIAHKQRLLEKHRQIAAKYDTFKAKVAELQVQLRKALLQLPGSKEIPALIRQISALGVRTGLQISLIRPQPEQQKTFYAEVPITVKVVGPYHAVGQFFDALAHLPRIVSVSQVHMNAQTKETRCLATTFRFLEDAKADAVASQK